MFVQINHEGNRLFHQKSIAYPCILFLIFVLLSSCQSSSSSLSETVVSHSAKIIRANSNPTDNIHRDETIILLGDSAAIFFTSLADDFPKQLSYDLADHLNQRLEQMVMFHSIQKTDTLDLFFKKNRSLNQLKNTYLESLARVSVSNKDISNRLGKRLNVKNFVALQVDRWPCPECQAPFQIKIKLRLIDAAAGYIIWTGINEISLDNSAEITLQQATVLLDELLDTFQYRFKRKWHRLRFQNLSLLAKN